MKLHLFKYNNYFNKIVKKEATLTNYGTAYTISDINFNPADGVNTTFITGTSDFGGLKDYCIVAEDNGTIISRWFIIEENRTRGGQYELTLKRDLIADYYDNIIKAPMMIDRAMISDATNPLLFNSEGFSYNQIKKQEYLLYDGLQSRWCYLYFKKGFGNKTITVNVDDSAYDMEITSPIATYLPTNGTWAGNTEIKNFIMRGITEMNILTQNGESGWNWYWHNNVTTDILVNKFSSWDLWNEGGTSSVIWFNQSFANISNAVNTMLTSNYAALSNAYAGETTNTCTLAQFNTWKELDGMRIKDSNNKIYLVSVNTTVNSSERYLTSGATRTAFNTMLTNSGIATTGSYGDKCFGVSQVERKIYVSYSEVTNNVGSISFTLYPNTPKKAETVDSEFNIIAIPYDGITFFYDSIYEESNLNIAQKLIRAITLENADTVDVQLLPYCPYPNIINQGVFYVRNIDSSQYEIITHQIPDPDDQTSFIDVVDLPILYLNSSNFTFDINTSQFANLNKYADNAALNKKICNEVELWRLVSPNYNGQFEFSMAKNDGCAKFNVDVTCKPYNPYIHINPDFKGLYGTDFDDSRGLICGGDFSLPMETTAWSNYELQNKNYQIAFDRQIQHLDFTQSQEKTIAGWQLATGIISGGIGSAIAGGMAAGPYGAIAGGIAGTAASAVGGGIDYSMMLERQAEDKSLAYDNFNYQLGNIKAIPHNINKVSPLTYNNKKFPFLEKYVATEQEINILKNKIAYSSMNVSAIGSLQEYIQTDKTFISGTLIRLEDTGLSSHEVNEIYKILKEGVYI